MATKITRNILEGHLKCKYKGHLKLAGEQGSKSDYEILLGESLQELRTGAIPKLVARQKDGEVLQGLALSRALLGQGAALILDSSLENDEVFLLFDGLKKRREHLSSAIFTIPHSCITKVGRSGRSRGHCWHCMA